jgi:murein DD-endopeptidase MepM/ murein hydrolase activator NlpD
MPRQAVAQYHPSDEPVHAGSHRPKGDRARRPARTADYTLAHAGRQVRVGPVAFWVVVGTLVIMASWSLATASYFAFREDVLTRLIARQTEMQFAYEDRIAELRAQVDRVTSRQLLDQEQFEQKLDQVLRRQTMLEARSTALGSIADPTPTGSIRSGGRGADGAALKPSPVGDRHSALSRERVGLRGKFADAIGFGSTTPATGMEGTIARVQASLDRVEARQMAALKSMEESVEAKARRMRGVLADLGLDAAKLPGATAPSAVGGPFVPFRLKADAGPFERQLHRIATTRLHVERLTRGIAWVPLRQPIDGELDTSSGYGMRMDPFIRAPAMHTGLDFRGSMGEPVRVTASGTVSQAGWNGGYGKMVEVEHSNGLSTRYAHLSEISVKVGQSVRIGQIVGRLGSTGRSTGPHLHYETRVDGDAVDPQKFLRAGMRLGLVQD